MLTLPAFHGDCMHEIRPRFWLGSMAAASNRSALSARGITHVLTLGQGLGQHMGVRGVGFESTWFSKRKRLKASAGDPFERLLISVLDCPSELLSWHFDASSSFISEAFSHGRRGGVLVHCRAGVSRSATAVAQHLMRTEGLTVDQALSSIRSAGRTGINPNDGFLSQLRVLEAELPRPQSRPIGPQNPPSVLEAPAAPPQDQEHGQVLRERLVHVSDCGLGQFNGSYVADGHIEGRQAFRKAREGRCGKTKLTMQTCSFSEAARAWYLCEDYKGYWYKAMSEGEWPPSSGWIVNPRLLGPAPQIRIVGRRCDIVMSSEGPAAAGPHGAIRVELSALLSGCATACAVGTDQVALMKAARSSLTGFFDVIDGIRGNMFTREEFAACVLREESTTTTFLGRSDCGGVIRQPGQPSLTLENCGGDGACSSRALDHAAIFGVFNDYPGDLVTCPALAAAVESEVYPDRSVVQDALYDALGGMIDCDQADVITHEAGSDEMHRAELATLLSEAFVCGARDAGEAPCLCWAL